MSKTLPGLTPELMEWIAEQKLFFVSTAPLTVNGHVNCSPKGGDSLRILGPQVVAYQDYTGSGAETAAHLRENGRIVLMFCAFAGPPKIVRLHGRGELITASDERYARFSTLFPPHAGTRAFVRIDIMRIAQSCGFSVPYFDYRGPRDTLDKWSASRSEAQLTEFRDRHCRRSIDGLPAFDISPAPPADGA